MRKYFHEFWDNKQSELNQIDTFIISVLHIVVFAYTSQYKPKYLSKFKTISIKNEGTYFAFLHQQQCFALKNIYHGVLSYNNIYCMTSRNRISVSFAPVLLQREATEIAKMKINWLGGTVKIRLV